MEVLVVGGHGQIALRLLALLAAQGHGARGLIRDAAQAADLERVGAEAVVSDLEQDDITPVVAGDAVVFAAGAGPGSGPERKRTVDLGGALKLIDACRANGIQRYLMISAIGARDPSQVSDAMRPYTEAKAEADGALESSGLAYTIVRPGRLTDDPGTGLIAAAPELEEYGSITRDDVAATMLATLGAANTESKTFELVQGEVPIAEAIAAL